MNAPKQIQYLGHTFDLLKDNKMPWGGRRCEYRSKTADFEIQIDYTLFQLHKEVRIWVGKDYLSFCDTSLETITCDTLNDEASERGMLHEFTALQVPER